MRKSNWNTVEHVNKCLCVYACVFHRRRWKVSLIVPGESKQNHKGWFLCALIYPILKELRAERVTGEDGTEEKMLGFWSLLVLSVLVGCICCVFSWMFTYLDSFQPGMDFPTLWTGAHVRDV
uniref:Uncharacterized protein n=1 Tax=Maylandia zebra TaxID=106582 RepID=A0A3P9DIG7_9CICH